MTVRVSFKNKLRSSLSRLIRRLGAVPEGQPDGLGQDSQLVGAAFVEHVLLIYPDGPSNTYQVLAWLPTLEHIHPQMNVAIVVQDSRVAQQLRSRTSLKVYAIARYSTFETMADNSQIALALYPAHHNRNFQYFRRTDFAHIYIGHGESDKAVSSSGQMRAYDFVFVAGQAAKDRARAIHGFNPDNRMITVGRAKPHRLIAGALSKHRPTVLYAPTWEGGQESMNYSSLTQMGEEIVGSLKSAGFTVVFRPHPRTGISDSRYKAVMNHLQSLAEPHHPNLVDDFNDADCLITDISSVAIDWLHTERPILVTNIAADPIDLDRLNPGDDVVAKVQTALASRTDYTTVRDHYLSNLGHDGFLRGCEEAINRFKAGP